jgi:hypothetical protein
LEAGLPQGELTTARNCLPSRQRTSPPDYQPVQRPTNGSQLERVRCELENRERSRSRHSDSEVALGCESHQREVRRVEDAGDTHERLGSTARWHRRCTPPRSSPPNAGEIVSQLGQQRRKPGQVIDP